MGLDELQSVQDELVTKLSKTSTLIQQQRSRSGSFVSAHSAHKPPVPSPKQSRRQRAEKQAIKELESMLSESSDEPSQLRVKPQEQERLTAKLQMFQQIRQRVGPVQSPQPHAKQTPQFNQVRATATSDDDLVYALNQQNINQSNLPPPQPRKEYNASLFNIIDEIEQPQPVLDQSYRQNPYFLKAKQQMQGQTQGLAGLNFKY